MTISLSSGTSRNTCPDYLYDARRSLPRREKCTLDAGQSRRDVGICDAYTRTQHHTACTCALAHILARVRVMYYGCLHILLTASACISGPRTCANEASIRERACARCGNLARNCYKKKIARRRKLNGRTRCVRPETRIAGRDTRGASPPADKACSENRGTIKNGNLNEIHPEWVGPIPILVVSAIDNRDNEVCRTFM